MKRFAVLSALLGFACAAPAAAQNVPGQTIERVIVTAPRLDFAITPDSIAHQVIRSIAAPSSLLNEIARWRTGICPRVDGLSTRNLNTYVIERIRELAKQVGAPVLDEPCQSNVEVFFTDQPQQMLDSVRRKNATVLGYHPADTINHAVQAWYVTGTTDIDGKTEADQDVSGAIQFTNGGGTLNTSPVGPTTLGFATTYGIPLSNIQGWKARPEVTSDILGVFIIADSNQTGAMTLGAVADYAAMLALSRLQGDESCQAVPSIINLWAPSCANKPDAISASDIGFLRGVYKMDPGATLQVQQDQIAGEMAKTISVRSGP